MLSFLEKIRHTSDTAKRAWVAVLSGAMMGLIVLIWISFFNTPFSGVAFQNGNANARAFFPTVRRGVAIVLEEVRNTFGAPRTLEFDRTKIRFAPGTP